MTLLSVAGAQDRLLRDVEPLAPRRVSLGDALGHYLAEPVKSLRTQPEDALSAMDGYAIRHADLPGPWRLIGESRAGQPFDGAVAQAEAVRISTAAIVPAGADCVLVREEALIDGDALALSGQGPAPSGHVRPAGSDFALGEILLEAGAQVTSRAIALAATAGYGEVSVGTAPSVALIATGDELVAPGVLAPHSTPSSNSVMLAAMLAPLGCHVVDFGIVRDRRDDLANVLAEAGRQCDIVVTSGGASVGDHDHLQGALSDAGGSLDFWRIAMKPGKPLLSGRLGPAKLLGLPGNPNSAFVTALLFLLPLCRKLAGSSAPLPRVEQRRLAIPVAAGGSREEYVRAVFDADGAVTPLPDQASGLLRTLAHADALLVRPIGGPALAGGQDCPVILL